MKIAVIGAGIAGMGAAWALSRRHDVTLFEQNGYIGGHSNTVDTLDGVPVDTGFIVFNQSTYPNLVKLFEHLDVPVAKSSMSFAVSVGSGKLEYSGDGLLTLFAQMRNLFRPRFHRMIRDILRFYRTAPELTEAADARDLTLGDFLEREDYSPGFVYDHLLPMGAAIWSASVKDMMRFPATSFVRFFRNHGLLSLKERPQWYTVKGGSREYVRRILADMPGRVVTNAGVSCVRRLPGSGVEVMGHDGLRERFDQVVIATHADQTLAMIDQPNPDEVDVLSAFGYQTNRAVLHRDATLMPRRRRTWASWNYMASGSREPGSHVSVTYWMNRLQPLDTSTNWFVTLNPLTEPDPALTERTILYDHPVFDARALEVQARIGEIQGADRLWFCGSYCGYGFHEDGLASGLAVAEALRCQAPWRVEDVSPAMANATPAPLPIAAE